MSNEGNGEAAVLHPEKKLTLGGRSVMLRPLTADDTFVVGGELAEIAVAIAKAFGQQQKKKAGLKLTDLDVRKIIAESKPALLALRTCIALCVDTPLNLLPIEAVPELIAEFLAQNVFPMSRWESLVGRLPDLLGRIGIERLKSTSTPATPSSS